MDNEEVYNEKQWHCVINIPVPQKNGRLIYIQKMYCQTFCLNWNTHQKPPISYIHIPYRKLENRCSSEDDLQQQVGNYCLLWGPFHLSSWSFKDNLWAIFTSNLPHLTNQKNSPQSNHPEMRPQKKTLRGPSGGPNPPSLPKVQDTEPMEILVSETTHPNKNWVVVCHPLQNTPIP